jgi:pyruvate dehydrogenase E2 component (dihydrolipoamide acetyltransferase)
MGEFRMPSLGADMDAGRVVAWHVKPGDAVKRGDIVAAVDTSKAEIDVEIFQDGVIEEILVPVGERVPVGTVLARVAGTGPQPAPPPTAPPSIAAAVAAAPPAAREAPPTPPAAPRRGLRVSPLARRAAAELGVDLATVVGTGPDGAIGRADVERAATPRPEEPAATPPAAAPGAPPPTREERQRSMRQAIGALMARSKREIPHYYVGAHIDLASAMAWLHEANARRPLARRLVPAALLLKATAVTARELPDLNGFWIDGELHRADGVHLGVAVALRGGGLIAPAIHDVDRMSLDELMAALRDLVRRVRDGGLRASEMSDPTLTVTDLGDQGVETVYGVIYPPQVALVGFGQIVERPWTAEGMVGARPLVHATLAGDHRASDGHQGARVLARIANHLQDPGSL